MSSILRERVIREMTLRSFSPCTHKSYLHALTELARFYMRALDQLSCDEVQQFLEYLLTVRELAWATVNVYFSACRFLYEQVLKWDEKQFSIPPRGRSGKRPGVLSQAEVLRLIEAPRNLKHRAILEITYGSGLRVSEAVKVRTDQVDRGRMMLRVDEGKGHKDRYTVLSKRSLLLLEQLWYKNKEDSPYFFYGRNPNKPVTTSTAQQVYYQALERSGVRRVGGIHVLRHCFATHLMEAGVDMYTIRKYMGHRNLITTAGYMHVTAEHLASVKSPADMICGF